ncbi:MAG TPA: ATP-grasp domain-containing protein, partial [Phaeodactylibacter sp.]|nr:ATP-grasp domain-containing protein [Phaeodactylibacter sp.]
MISSNYKIGILGGGQLGKMLALAAQNWDVQTWILDTSKDFPAGNACTHFVEGDFRNYDDVIRFGKNMDVITVEIETVNTDALLQLQADGKKIHPRPEALNLIKDKGLQKQFYVDNNLPTSSFEVLKEVLPLQAVTPLPFVQKARTGGYDGRGVAIIRSEADLEKILPVPSIIEPLVNIQKELGVVVARNESGEVKAFSVVDMEFNAEVNLVDYLICPSTISPAIEKQAKEIAMATIEAYDIFGLLAVELFLTTDNQLLINEVAPRP